MHRSIAAWLTEHPWQAVIATAVCGLLSQLLPPLLVFATAIPVLMALQRDARFALTSAIAGVITTGGGAIAAGDPAVMWVGLGFAGVYFGALLLGLLLKRTGSLNLCFQVAVLAAAVMIVIVHAVLRDPIGIWTPVLHQLVASLEAGGWPLGANKATIIEIWARTMWGAVATLALLVAFGGLLIGRWWQTLLQAPGTFGVEYRKLRLGSTLGVAITAVFVAVYLVESPLLSSLAWVSFCALTFQGLAAAHRSKANGRLNQGWLAAIYVLLIVPLSAGATVFVLAIWGFADNWLRLRAQNA